MVYRIGDIVQWRHKKAGELEGEIVDVLIEQEIDKITSILHIKVFTETDDCVYNKDTVVPFTVTFHNILRTNFRKK